jgi:hypothetical protein
MWTIPLTITQGDRITWKQALDGYNNITDTLACFVRGLSGGLDLTGIPLPSASPLLFCQLINDELLEYNLEEVRSLKIDAQEIYC